MFECRLDHENVTEDVRVERLTDFFLRVVLEFFVRRLHRCIVDENIQTAKRLNGFIDESLTFGCAPDVALKQKAFSPVTLDEFFCLLRIVIARVIDDRHVGALFREANRDRAPNPRVSAGNERALSV